MCLYEGKNNYLRETNLLYEQTSLGIRKRFQAFDAHPKDDMRLLKVDPLMSGCMYVVEVAVQQRESLALKVENRGLMEDIVYM